MRTPDVAATFDGETLLYSPSFTVELGLLLHGPEDARRMLGGFRRRFGDCDFADQLDELLGQPLLLPSNDEERIERALGLVRLVGRAVGEELIERGYRGELDPLQAVFRKAMLAISAESVTGSTLEKLFYRCGQELAGIVGGVLLKGGPVEDGVFIETLYRATDAFGDGLREVAA